MRKTLTMIAALCACQACEQSTPTATAKTIAPAPVAATKPPHDPACDRTHSFQPAKFHRIVDAFNECGPLRFELSPALRDVKISAIIVPAEQTEWLAFLQSTGDYRITRQGTLVTIAERRQK